jgi:hypothetical protein
MTTVVYHKDLPPKDNHPVHRWEFNTEAERLALVPTSVDLGKIAWERSGERLYILTSVSPVTWTGIPTGERVTKGNFVGEVAAVTGTSRLYFPQPTVVRGVYASIGTAAGSGGVVYDVRKNGLSIMTNPKPAIAAGEYKSTVRSLSVGMTVTDYLTVDVIQAGSGARDLVVYIIHD